MGRGGKKRGSERRVERKKESKGRKREGEGRGVRNKQLSSQWSI